MADRTYFSVLHRLLHWSIALGIFLALFTAFLHHFWMNSHIVGSSIVSALAERNIKMSQDEAYMMARELASPMFHWHFYAGYVVAGLLVLRIIDFIVYGRKFISPFSKEATAKQKLQGWLYILFYIALFIMLAMGLLLLFGPGQWHDIYDVIHVWGGYIIGIFVILHFGGLWLGEITDDKGIVSKMVNGGK
ncbi:MAG: cytochrome b/b6 domain-containing protein [Tannerella sp.]|jgi:cytochrome b561|nr:cytochrome b/b6 domain-containing protein [Tannerella sp.]